MYDKAMDELYETAIFVDEFLKLRDYVGQAFFVMNASAQWGHQDGVDFHGNAIKTGNAKGSHQYWVDYIANKPAFEPRYSEHDGQALRVDKSLRNCILFSQRMNLHIRNVLDENGELKLGGFDENGNINYDLDDYCVMEIGWIVEPLKFLSECFPLFLNKLKASVVTGMNSNWGQLTRGATGTLFEDFCLDAHTVLAGQHAAEISDIDVHVQGVGQKQLINSKVFLHKIPF
jgi:hypothetical protein